MFMHEKLRMCEMAASKEALIKYRFLIATGGWDGFECSILRELKTATLSDYR